MGYGQNNQNQERQVFSLLELNNRVKGVVLNAFPETCWVRAEMSDVRTNAASGHCYLEFIEKNAITGQLVAKARGSIWAKTFRMLKPYFEMETGQIFASGLKVLVKVSIEFHELYGYSLTVLDIDPAYTLGDMIRKRMEIIRQLKEEGVFTLNKELPLPTLPKRIAVITSLTAAGYEDFLNQLANNKAGYPFYPKLFPALMQGERTEESVIAALDRVYRHADCFDVVVIIRGGGATSDLNSFDSYLLAANCAQFPLPIITGIGHERDDTILDMVAHTRMKTPTAVAEFLIGQMDKAAGEVEELQQDVCSLATEILSRQKNFLQSLGSRLPVLAINRIERNRSLLQRIGMQLPTDAHAFLNQWASKLEAMQVRLANRAESSLAERSRFVQLTEQFIKMASPDYVLKRGYSLTLKDGKIINFLGKKNICFILSIAVIVAGWAGMALHKGQTGYILNYGMDFTGGTSTNVTFNEDMSLDDISAKVVPVVSKITGDADVQTQKVAGTNEVIIKTKTLDVEQRQQLEDAMVENFGVDAEKITAESISGAVSTEMKKDAVWAVTIATVLMLLYIWFRFKDIRFAASAILALVHDVLVVVTFYSLAKWSVGSTFIACMLTIVGYSINATIVIFDRIRENLALKKAGSKQTLEEIVNLSITQTFTRSINTSLTTFIMVFVLFLLGVSSIREFALPLMVGIVCGTYSSVCVTGALWYVLTTRKQKKAEK